jgi:hypothetical protein
MFKPTYKNFGTVTNPATVTKSIGLLAFALLSWFLHRHLDNFTVTRNLSPLSGLSHLDKFAWTRKILPTYRDFAKTHANPDTDGNSLYHRAVSIQARVNEHEDNLHIG